MRTAAGASRLVRVLAAVAGLLAVAGPAHAQKPKVKIASARIGLPPGGRTTDRDESGAALHICKFAAWAPVYVELEILDDVKEPAELVVETPDADEVATTLTVPLNLADLRPGQVVSSRDLGLMPYLRPTAGTGETTITVRTVKGTALTEPFRIRFLRPKDSLTYVVLSLGSKLSGFDLPKPPNVAADATTLRNGRVETAAITDVGMLPDQWFGYDAADLVILATTSDEFLDRLFGEKASASDKVKRAALLEWVRHGGRLVVSVGSNAALAAKMPALQALLPQSIKADAPTRSVPSLALFWTSKEGGTATGTLTPKGGGPLAVPNLAAKPGRPGRVLIPPPSRQTDDREPVAVQAAFGLGRVTLVGFDLDRSPFNELPNRTELWDWVLREGGAVRASVGPDNKNRPNSAMPSEDEDEFATALRTHIDTFDGVPVISFGWVAVFILLYILLIGPVEYFFLKKVLGRLELTWITFPIIVITVSAAAYFTAYAVKGRDLKVNKVDLVEVVAETDPITGKPGGRVYGTTWFTVFSPRIDTYQVGVTPNQGWTHMDASDDSLVGWVGGPRGGRASLIRRRYAYHVDPQAGVVANGLEGVPIQVWSTKSFTATWSGAMDPVAPAVESRLEHPSGAPTRVVGTFVNRMPFEQVTDCVAFYAGQAYSIGTILKGQEVRPVLDKGQPATAWLQERSELATIFARVSADRSGTSRYGSQPAATGPSSLTLWGLLFHESALRNDEGVIARNSSLRKFDQSWRLNPENRDEVILVGRVLPPPGEAEPLVGGAPSPSKLWLKELPSSGKARPPVLGTARQETYVRVYLPVKPAR